MGDASLRPSTSQDSQDSGSSFSQQLVVEGQNDQADASEPDELRVQADVQAPKLPRTKVNKGTQLSQRRPICRSKGTNHVINLVQHI